jgi:hypothetical protein
MCNDVRPAKRVRESERRVWRVEVERARGLKGVRRGDVEAGFQKYLGWHTGF